MLWFRRKFKGTPSDLTSTAGGTTGSWFDRSDCSDQLLWWLSFFYETRSEGSCHVFFLDACHDLEALHSWCLLFTCKMFLEFWFNLSSNTIFSRILSLVVSFVLYMRLNYLYIYTDVPSVCFLVSIIHGFKKGSCYSKVIWKCCSNLWALWIKSFR